MLVQIKKAFQNQDCSFSLESFTDKMMVFVTFHRDLRNNELRCLSKDQKVLIANPIWTKLGGIQS